MWRTLFLLAIAIMLAGCGQVMSPTTGAPAPTGTANLTQVMVGLDWTPNTNHTGLYVARAQGYYRANGLEVTIVPPQEGGTVEQLVASGKLDFGVSYQEGVTQARAQGLPIVSIAAVIQHNTSGFLARKEEGIASPKDFEGKKYGAFGSPVEKSVITGLMQCAGGDPSKVQFVEIGGSDFLAATARDQVDFVWVFKGWEGIRVQQAGVPTTLIMLNDLKCIPDYYTPVLITSEQTIAERPKVVRRFMQATAQGYNFAIQSPDQAADLLLKAAPELDAKLVKASQHYLAGQYQADAPRWGEQQLAVWRDYAKWMADHQLLPKMIEPEKAFTNIFLP